MHTFRLEATAENSLHAENKAHDDDDDDHDDNNKYNIMIIIINL